jgi:hypothetical protein
VTVRALAPGFVSLTGAAQRAGNGKGLLGIQPNVLGCSIGRGNSGFLCVLVSSSGGNLGNESVGRVKDIAVGR